MAANNVIIRLNVGGTSFHTTHQTLCKEPDSFLARFCEVDGMRPSVKDDSGAFFIDRDPRYFRIVLNYLRANIVDLEDNVSLDALLAEADFYCLSGLVRRLEDMRGNSLPKSQCSTVKSVWVRTHQRTSYDTSYTTFTSTDAEVLARIMSTENANFPKHSVVNYGRRITCERYKLKKVDICDILEKCGFVLRFIKEKSEGDEEFFFSNV